MHRWIMGTLVMLIPYDSVAITLVGGTLVPIPVVLRAGWGPSDAGTAP